MQPRPACREASSVRDLDPFEWDASLGAGNFYASRPWLRVAEETADIPPFYLRLTIPGGALATLPCYPMAADSPFPFCRLNFLAAQFIESCAVGEGADVVNAMMPSLFLGGRNPAHTRIGASAVESDSAWQASVLHDLLAEAENAAQRRALRSVGMLYVDEGMTVLRQVLTERGYVCFPHYRAAVLDVPDGGFDAYIQGTHQTP